MALQRCHMIFIGVLFLNFWSETKGHFLSLEDLEEFYDLEEKLVDTFTTYIKEQKQILDVIKQRYELQKRWQPVINDTDVYLGNPLNVHAMFKRLVMDWPLTLSLLEGSFAEEEDEELMLPSVQEYVGAVHSIARLHQVYGYTIQELVSGSAFPGTDNTSVLTVDDCLAVGKDLYDHRYYNTSIGWFKEALSQAINQSEGVNVASANTGSGQTSAETPLEQIYEYLALATCFIGDQKQSKKFFNKLYSEFPDFRPTQGLMKHHLMAVNDTCKKLLDDKTLKPITHGLGLSWRQDAILSKNYTKLCKATSVHLTPQALSCSLEDFGDEFWRLQPFKIEELHIVPGIYMVYDIISLAERQFIKEKMMDESFMEHHGAMYEFWLPLPAKSSVTSSLVRRSEAITGATVHNKRHHVLLSSYPPGGETIVHLDIGSKQKNPAKFRLGSTRFFLDEPQKGGRIVFPRLGLSVAPVAGAALTIFNINSTEQIEHKSAYGVCPVIQGHETMLTLWFKEK